MQSTETDALRLSVAVRHAEDWSSEYARDPATHLKLLKTEAQMRGGLTTFFRDLAADIVKHIHWQGYLNQRTQKLDDTPPDFDVSVLVQDVPLDQYDGQFIKIVFNDLALMTTIGAMAGETIYHVPLGIQSTDAIIQQLTTDHVAKLVGKKVLKDGKIVNNSNADYRISTKTRNDIVQSIKTSLNLGEDITAATERLQKTIANPMRAKLIAQTESVNAYQQGMQQFGVQSGAVGKEWQDTGAVDVCAEYAALGPVPFDYEYGGLWGPSAHPRCRCGTRLIYQAEWDRMQQS